MGVNFFPLNTKCFWKCLNCNPPAPENDHTIKKIIDASKNRSINIFSQYTLNLNRLSQFIKYSDSKKQKSAIICHELIIDKLVYLQADYLIFPLFSTVPEIHNQFTNSQSFYKIISNIQHLGKKQKRIVMFFVNKDNFSDLTDLNALSATLNAKMWIIPISIYSNQDFSDEDILYLNRLNRYKNLFYSPVDSHLLKNGKANNLCYLLKSSLPYKSIRLKLQMPFFYRQLFK